MRSDAARLRNARAVLKGTPIDATRALARYEAVAPRSRSLPVARAFARARVLRSGVTHRENGALDVARVRARIDRGATGA